MKPTTPISDPEKLRKLQELAILDAQHPDVIAAAQHIRELVALLGPTNPDRLIVQIIHAIARDGIPYELDTKRVGGEDIAGVTRDPEHPFAVFRRKDDCDAKARIFVALCRAAGFEAEILPLWKGADLSHVLAKVRVGGSWLPAELTLARARLGDEPFAVPFEREKQDWKRT